MVERGQVSAQTVVRSLFLVYLLCSSDAHGQTPPDYRGYVGVLAGATVLTAGDRGDPLDGTAPVLGGWLAELCEAARASKQRSPGSG